MSTLIKNGHSMDTAHLEKELGMPIKVGKISKQHDKYSLMIEKKKIEIPMGTIISPEDINHLVDKDVAVVYSKTEPDEIFAIGLYEHVKNITNFKKWIICYIPNPEFKNRIDPEIRQLLLKKMFEKNIITSQVKEMF